MPPFDREAALKGAEKAIKQGRVDAAIAEYLKIVDAQPRDWNSANALGDLYVRANQIEKGVQQFTRIADHLANEGFYPKAAALYKKIVKIVPDDEYAMLRSGDMAARQDKLADARQVFTQLMDRRQARGDRKGAAEMAVRLGMLDPDNYDARLRAARLAAEMGDTATALREYQEVAARLERQGRSADALAALGAAYDLDRSNEDLQARLLAAVNAVADLAVGEGHFASAAAALRVFTARAPLHLVALMRLVEVCVDGGLEAEMYEAQAQLADAYLASGRALEARIISEDLLAREPGSAAHVDRFRRALVMLGEADPEAVIAERLSGENLFLAAEMLDLNEGTNFGEPAALAAPVPPVPPVAPATPVAPAIDDEIGIVVEIDLTEALAEPAAPPAESEVPSPPLPLVPPPPRSLDQVFRGLRDDSLRQSSEEAAAEQYRLALTYHEMGMMDDAIRALEGAARSPRQRFDAASMLGRLYLEREDQDHAIEWLERAAEAPAPTPDAGRALLYDLASVLERMGEHARALAVFVELEAESGGYRDVAGQIDRLSKVQARG